MSSSIHTHFHIFKNFLVLNSFLLDLDRFCQDPYTYKSSPWIRIRNEFFHILDPDPYNTLLVLKFRFSIITVFAVK